MDINDKGEILKNIYLSKVIIHVKPLILDERLKSISYWFLASAVLLLCLTVSAHADGFSDAGKNLTSSFTKVTTFISEYFPFPVVAFGLIAAAANYRKGMDSYGKIALGTVIFALILKYPQEITKAFAAWTV